MFELVFKALKKTNDLRIIIIVVILYIINSRIFRFVSVLSFTFGYFQTM